MRLIKSFAGRHHDVCRTVVLLSLVLTGCQQQSPTSPPAPDSKANCAGVRGPVLAIVLGGGSLLLPPDPDPTLEQLTRDLASVYWGSWQSVFTQRYQRDVNEWVRQVDGFLTTNPTGEVVLIGHSSGGADGDAIARRLPGRSHQLWLITIDPVEDTPTYGQFETRLSPLADRGPVRHFHIMQPAPGPTIPQTPIQLGIKLDYAAGSVRRHDLPNYDHYTIKEPAVPLVHADLVDRFGACRR